MNYSKYFALEVRLKKKGFDLDRKELLELYTFGAKSSFKELDQEEFEEFLEWIKQRFNLRNDWKDNSENQMRRKVIALFIHHMGYTYEGLENWCVKYGKFKKKLNDHTRSELIQLVNQAENTYASFTKSVSK